MIHLNVLEPAKKNYVKLKIVISVFLVIYWSHRALFIFSLLLKLFKIKVD